MTFEEWQNTRWETPQAAWSAAYCAGLNGAYDEGFRAGMERAAEICDEKERAKWENVVNGNRYEPGTARACVKAIRAELEKADDAG